MVSSKNEKILFFSLLVFSLLMSLLLVSIFSLGDISSNETHDNGKDINTIEKGKSLSYYYSFCEDICKNDSYYADCNKICYNLAKKYDENELKDKVKSDCFKKSFIKVLEKGECNDNCLECKKLNNCELSLKWCEGGYK